MFERLRLCGSYYDLLPLAILFCIILECTLVESSIMCECISDGAWEIGKVIFTLQKNIDSLEKRKIE